MTFALENTGYNFVNFFFSFWLLWLIRSITKKKKERKKEMHQGRTDIHIQQCKKEEKNTPETIKSPGALNSNYYTEYYPQGHINKVLLPNKRN